MCIIFFQNGVGDVDKYYCGRIFPFRYLWAFSSCTGNLREISLIKQKLLINMFFMIKFHIWFEQKRLNISLMSWAYGSKQSFAIIIFAMTNLSLLPRAEKKKPEDFCDPLKWWPNCTNCSFSLSLFGWALDFVFKRDGHLDVVHGVTL